MQAQVPSWYFLLHPHEMQASYHCDFDLDKARCPARMKFHPHDGISTPSQWLEAANPNAPFNRRIHVRSMFNDFSFGRAGRRIQSK
jgi:hypothetical protein